MEIQTQARKMTDEELVRAYLTTHRNQYFSFLYQRYFDRVYRKCLSYTKDSANAEDYTQDIFLKLYARLSSFKEESKFSTWLFSVTNNYCTDQLRHIRTRSMTVANTDMFPDVCPEEDKGWVDVNEKILAGALARLSTYEQSLLTMKYQENFSVPAIAKMNNLSESAVKMRLKRSREKLRKHYLQASLAAAL